MTTSLIVYRRLNFIKRYNLKFLFISFIGIHIPLLTIIFFVVFSEESQIDTWHIIVLTLIATLIASALTLGLLEYLLAPVELLKNGLKQYHRDQKVPQLPTHFQDELGILMAQTQATLEKTQQLIEEKADLVGIISHDLRSPVNQIAGLTQILKIEEPLSENQRHYLQMIERLCTQHSNLLKDLLCLLQQEELDEKHFESVSIVSLIQECVAEKKNELERKKLTVEFNPHKGDLTIPAEKALLKQAVQNILHNAVKFSYQESLIIVQTYVQDNSYCIAVTDHGVGFDPDLSSQLFDKFTKLGKRGTLQEPSTGLGLHLTQKIVESHGGEIRATSKGKDQGSTFVIRFPLREPQGSDSKTDQYRSSEQDSWGAVMS